jgi:hypothetical protein
MNLASTIREMAEKKNKPPFDTGKDDFAGAAKKIRDYAKKSGGIDKDDMLRIANELDALAKKSSPRLLARTMKNIESLDTDVRDKIKELMKESNCMEALELDEAMVRGKEVFDKTFANKTQADNFAQKNGGRVKKVGRVFYVFKESNAEDESPASPDEGSMAKTQLEFIEYAAEEIAEHIQSGKRFPEWMQNKLSQAHEKMKGLHAALGDHGDEEMNEDFELDEAKSKEQQIADLEKMLNRISGNTSSVKMKKVALQRKIDKLKNEELEEAKRNPSKSGGSGYDLYHKDFSSAMQHAYDYAKSKLGVEVDPKEIDDKVASGPRKPSKGKTNTYRLKGKDGKKAVQIQVYGMDDGKYELNMYKESVELDELKKYDKNADFRVLNRLSQKQKTGKLTPAEKKQMDNAKSRLRNHGVTEDFDINEEFDALFEEQTFGGVTHSKSVLDAIASVVEGRKVKKEDNTNDKSDDGEGMDKVQPKALKKKFKDRKDKDLDNDGDVDDSDEYLHNRRKTVSKEVGKDDDGKDTPPKKKSPPKKEKEDSPDEEDKEKENIGKSGKQTKVDTNPSLSEEEMTDAEKDKMEKIKTKLDKKKDEFVKKYGDRAKEVIARTAIKMAKKST